MKKITKIIGVLSLASLLLASCSSPAGGGSGSSSGGNLSGTTWIFKSENKVPEPPAPKPENPNPKPDTKPENPDNPGGETDKPNPKPDTKPFQPQPVSYDITETYLYFMDSQYCFYGKVDIHLEGMTTEKGTPNFTVKVPTEYRPYYAGKYTTDNGKVKFDLTRTNVKSNAEGYVWLEDSETKNYTSTSRGIFDTYVEYSKGSDLVLKPLTAEQGKGTTPNVSIKDWVWEKDSYNLDSQKLTNNATAAKFQRATLLDKMYIANDSEFFTAYGDRIVTGKLIKNTTMNVPTEYFNKYVVTELKKNPTEFTQYDGLLWTKLVEGRTSRVASMRNNELNIINDAFFPTGFDKGVVHTASKTIYVNKDEKTIIDSCGWPQSFSDIFIEYPTPNEGKGAWCYMKKSFDIMSKTLSSKEGELKFVDGNYILTIDSNNYKVLKIMPFYLKVKQDNNFVNAETYDMPIYKWDEAKNVPGYIGTFNLGYNNEDYSIKMDMGAFIPGAN